MHWINQQGFLPEKFAWQRGYGAFSVSESQVERLAGYIYHQKDHFRNASFEEDFHKLLEKYRLLDKLDQKEEK